MIQILIEIAKQRSSSLQLRLAQTTQSPGAGVRLAWKIPVLMHRPCTFFASRDHTPSSVMQQRAFINPSPVKKPRVDLIAPPGRVKATIKGRSGQSGLLEGNEIS